MRVLVVDDSVEVRSRLIELLSDIQGIEIAEAGSADEALEHLERFLADIVVLDLHIGARTGLDLITKVTLMLPSAMIMVLTNDWSPALWRECLKRGASFFFDKSRDFERAVDAVAHALAGSDPERVGGEPA
ncbi:MAG TPA: response regulator [Polyangiaceae bacterium]